MANASLNATRRERELEALAGGEEVDLLVIGLGVTGTGVALDAVTRGLSVAAIDAHDLAFGTSRWSSKLAHGGLRYLANLEVAIAHESAVERGILMEHTAPHLVRPLPMVLPLTPFVKRGAAIMAGVGLFAGDGLRLSARTSRATLPRPRRLSRAETIGAAPLLRTVGLRGGLLSWDGQLEDDARLVTTIARTAAANGARIITRCRAEEVDGSGADVHDSHGDQRLRIRAKAVINATGVWSDQVVPNLSLRPSRGTHIVLRAETLGGLGAALTVPVPGETARFVFALPEPDGRVYVGLTDEPIDGEMPDVPTPPEGDIGFLLDVIGSALEVPLRRDDVVGAFAGLRPLIRDDHGGTSDVSRAHAVRRMEDGVVTIVGGKLTTYRRMAEDAVDAVLGRGLLTGAGPCRTARLPLVGAGRPNDLGGLPAPRRIVRRYGSEAPAVLAAAEEDPELLEPISAEIETTRAELLWAVHHEGALGVDDMLDRRTRVGLIPADREVALPAAEEMLERGRLAAGAA